jgi:hypothetical protein
LVSNSQRPPFGQGEGIQQNCRTQPGKAAPRVGPVRRFHQEDARNLSFHVKYCRKRLGSNATSKRKRSGVPIRYVLEAACEAGVRASLSTLCTSTGSWGS